MCLTFLMLQQATGTAFRDTGKGPNPLNHRFRQTLCFHFISKTRPLLRTNTYHMPFQLNDYVRIKPGVILTETNEPVPDGWEGQIAETPVTPEDNTYLVELDAPSLEKLPEKYLADCIENEEMPVAYYFEESDLEPSVCRDTPEERRAIQDRLENLIFPIPEEELLDEAQIAQWYEAFEQSEQYANLPPGEQEEAKSTLELFADYAFNYRGDQPKDWTVGTLREVCLERFPKRLSAPIESFEHTGRLLIQFFDFLAEHQSLNTASQMQQEMRRIAPEMIRLAKNPRNWGMAKSMIMDALQAGVDMSNTQALNEFMAKKSAARLAHLDLAGSAAPNRPVMRPVPENHFKNLSRNQLIRVKYPDGSIREGKFKRLEAELRAGKCELVS